MTEALHYGALLPALGLWPLRRRLPDGAGLVACAFAVSWLGDMWALVAGGAWYGSYLWLPVQLGLALYVVADWDALGPLLAILALLAAYDIGTASGPDVVITAVGSAAIVTIAIRTAHPLAVPLVLYFGLGSALYLVMVSQAPGGTFLAWWWAYQSARVLAWAAFLGILWRNGR